MAEQLPLLSRGTKMKYQTLRRVLIGLLGLSVLLLAGLGIAQRTVLLASSAPTERAESTCPLSRPLSADPKAKPANKQRKEPWGELLRGIIL
jgi:hypothetical protein